MRRKARRLVLIVGALGVGGLAAGLVLFGLRDSVVFFYAPTELVAKAPAPGTRLRVGGLVEQGSVAHTGPNTISFAVTDANARVQVSYTGLLPDLFREGQGVVAEGALDASGSFRAESVLAKHDETYMPRDVADALKKKGEWRGEAATSVAPPSAFGEAAPGRTAKR